MRAVCLLVIFCLVAACGRPLTDGEASFALSLMGSELDTSRVRLVEGAPGRNITFERPARPRLACRDRILPPPKSTIVTTSPAAVAVLNTVLVRDDWYLADYAETYPDRLRLLEAMFFAHEMIHVWQWQNRDKTGYHPFLALAEHQNSPDPYLFDLNTAPEFLDFGYEQQGAIMEEYICCRALDPLAPRTKRLETMLSRAMPLTPFNAAAARPEVVIPWRDAPVQGICSTP